MPLEIPRASVTNHQPISEQHNGAEKKPNTISKTHATHLLIKIESSSVQCSKLDGVRPGLELYLAVISPHQSPNLYVNLGVVTNSISNIF